VKIGNPEQPNKKDPVGSFLLGNHYLRPTGNILHMRITLTINEKTKLYVTSI
jgi:hypothetical protein